MLELVFDGFADQGISRGPLYIIDIKTSNVFSISRGRWYLLFIVDDILLCYCWEISESLEVFLIGGIEVLFSLW